MNLVYNIISHFLKIHFNIILSSTLMLLKWSLPFRFTDNNVFMHLSSPPELHMSTSPYNLSFLHPNYIRWNVQIMKLHIMQFLYHFPVTYSLLFPTNTFITLFSKTSIYVLLLEWDTHITQQQNIILYISVFTFSDRMHEN